MSDESMRPGDRMRAYYALAPVDHLPRTEFGFMEGTLARWKAEGLPDDWRERNLFQFDPPGMFATQVNLGWCEPPFRPAFEVKVVKTEGEYEIYQDIAGRWVKVFAGRRQGFMPEYVRHAVASMADWEAVAPRLSPDDAGRWQGLPELVRKQRAAADAVGGMLTQKIIGGYMYLRALIGPVELLYMFHDNPQVIHAAMRAWLALANEALRRVQAEAEIDEIFLAEDICYNHGLLISPDTMREFLLPYYQQLIADARSRQSGPVLLHIDTDGDCRPSIPIYSELGLARMSPFEVASNCDVVAIAREYPNLAMSGGIDKRVLAQGKDAIDRHLEYILPFMFERGGYYPTSDHGVPCEVSLENYMHYRRRVCELDHR
ncbi:MAG: Uroporphyrinogen decarboxylase (URO-D) [candidate division BRC1 bacterium ADurb.BinA364]|nr:MAG: Uroporphyrinogen decarboxylase (URO-D) [candidate division BRC1 bacterium ADurb.BinA364]